MERIPTPGQVWHVVSNSWVEKWQNYTFFDYLGSETKKQISFEERVHPGKIDSTDIILVPPKNSFLEDTTSLRLWQNI